MTATQVLNGKQQFIDQNGVPLVGGKVYFYIPNTSTLKNTWQDPDQHTLNNNPVTLDMRGQAVIFGVGQYRQVLRDANGNLIWDQLTESAGSGSSSGSIVNPGFQGFVNSVGEIPTVPITGLLATLPAGSAILNDELLTFPVINAVVDDESVTDYWLSSDGAISVESEPISNYIALPHFNDKLHLWRIQSEEGNVTALYLMANTTPTVTEPTDVSRTVAQFPEFYVISGDTTPWSAGLTVSFRELLVTSTGNVYQVFTPGVTGSVAPTSTAEGEIDDGTAVLFYYSQSCFGNNFRYAINNGINSYFSNIAAKNICGMRTGYGVQMRTYVKDYILNQIYHVVNDWQSSSNYGFGQKVISDGFIWLNTTFSGGTTAGSNAAFVASRPHSVGQTVVDNTITWECIYQSYGGQTWFWMDTDRTMLDYRPPDSNDSYASTFLDLVWRYVQVSGDIPWLSAASSQPGLTVEQVLDGIYDTNLSNQIANNLTRTFQDDVNPFTGGTYDVQFLEDNCESYSGFGASAQLFSLLGDSIRAANALYLEGVVASGIYNLFSTTYNIFATNYGQDVATFANNPDIGFYPYIQAQYFPELHQVVTINDDQKQQVRTWVYDRWTSFISDRGKDTTASAFFGYIAARFWNDPIKAYSIVNIVERNFLANNSINITDFSYYLLTKDYLITPSPILYTGDFKILVQRRGGGILEIPTVDQFRNSASEAATVLGSVTRRIEAFDQYGNSIGFIPIYDSIS